MRIRNHVLNENGHEMPDPTPIEPPLNYKRTPSLAEQIREQIRSERLAMELEGTGAETFEEADDFDIPDDPVDPSSPWEGNFDPLPQILAEEAAKNAEARSRATPPPQPEAKPPTEPPSGDNRPAKPAGDPQPGT